MEYRILAVEMVFRLPYAHSLKDKRQLGQSLRGRLEARWRLSVLECGSQDLWQRLELVAVMAMVGEQAARDRGAAGVSPPSSSASSCCQRVRAAARLRALTWP